MAENHLVIPETMQAQFIVIVGSVPTRVITHFIVPGGAVATPTTANVLFDSVKALWSTNLAPHSAPTTTFQRVDLRDLRQPAQPLVSSSSTAVVGTSPAGEALPRQIAACLTVRTSFAGRKYRGRMYWAGFAESANGADNHMTTAAKAAIDAFCAGFLTASNQQSWAFAVAHRPTAFDPVTGLPVTPGLGFSTAATSVVCRDDVWDTQRRRAG